MRDNGVSKTPLDQIFFYSTITGTMITMTTAKMDKMTKAKHLQRLFLFCSASFFLNKESNPGV